MLRGSTSTKEPPHCSSRVALLMRTAAAAMTRRKVPVSSWFQKSRMYL